MSDTIEITLEDGTSIRWNVRPDDTDAIIEMITDKIGSPDTMGV